MMEQADLKLRHLEDLCRRAERTGRWFYSSFLTLAEQEDFRRLPVSRTCRTLFWGGLEQAERKILAAGDDPEEPNFPLTVLRIEPVSPKFAEELSHRDYLGALLNLGMERDVIGDILVEGKEAWVICLNAVGDLIRDGLHRVRRTEVRVTEADPEAEVLQPRFEPLTLNVPSERLDAIVAGLTGLSREKASALLAAEKVFVNSRPVAQRDVRLKPGDVLSVRGYGKAIYDGIDRESRKGRLFLSFRKYA